VSVGCVRFDCGTFSKTGISGLQMNGFFAAQIGWFFGRCLRGVP